MRRLIKYTLRSFGGLILCLGFGYISLGQVCTGQLAAPIVNITFGTGIGTAPLFNTSSGASTVYNYVANECPNDGNYTVTNTTSNCYDNSWFTVAEDHTPDDVNGRMAIFNASYTSGEFYRQVIGQLCGNTTYELSYWLASLMRPEACKGNGIDPNLTCTIETINGLVLATFSTGAIPETNELLWRPYQVLFRTPATDTQVIIKFRNNAPGGCGNDIALDDMMIRPCMSSLNITTSTNQVCEGQGFTLNSTLTGGFEQPQYQWQQSLDHGNSWQSIAEATSGDLTVSSAQTGILYRVLAAEAGNLHIEDCRLTSAPASINVLPAVHMTLPIPTGDTLNVCAGSVVNIPFNNLLPNTQVNWTLDNPNVGLTTTSGQNAIPTFTAYNPSTTISTGTFSFTTTTEGCISPTQHMVLQVYPAPTVSVGADQIVPMGQHITLSAVAASGKTPYLFWWSPESNIGQSKTIVANTSATYTVWVTDALGCQDADSVNITVGIPPKISSLNITAVGIYGDSTGAVNINATGSSSLTYSLDGLNFQSLPNFTHLKAGTYTLSIKDSMGLITKQVVVIEEPDPLTLTISVKPSSTYPNTNEVLPLVTGGVGPYQFVWSDGVNIFTSLVGKPAGTYTLTVTDANGAQKTATFTTTAPTSVNVKATVTNVTYHGGSNGQIVVVINSQTNTQSLVWKDSTHTIIATGDTLANIPAGTYTLFITDSNNAVDSVSFVVSQPSALQATTSLMPLTCANAQDAKILVTAQGGSGTLQYALCNDATCNSTSPWQLSPIFDQLGVGTYRIVVRDAHGARLILPTVAVASPTLPVAVANSNSPLCEGTTLILNANDAGSGATYEWRNPKGVVIGTTRQLSMANVSSVDGGIYGLTVTLISGCQNIDTVLVTVRPRPTVFAGKDRGICFGDTVTLNASATEGQTPYSFDWDQGIGQTAAISVSPSFSNQYVVKATDNHGCSDTDTVRIEVINKPALFTISAPNDRTICAGVNGIAVTLNGSEPNVLYELVKNGQPLGYGKIGTGQPLSFGYQFGGTYQVRATTLTSPTCYSMMSDSVIVNELPPLTASLLFQEDTICVGESMKYDVVAQGGSGDYTYTWQDEQGGNSRSFTTQNYLLVQVTVRDTRGCQVVLQANLRAMPLLTANLTATPACMGDSMTLSATASDGSGQYLYQWQDGNQQPTRKILATNDTTFQITITDAMYGCVVQKSLPLTIQQLPALKIDSTVCSSDKTSFILWLTTEPNAVGVISSEGVVVDLTNGRYEITAISTVGNPTLTITVTHLLTGCQKVLTYPKPNCQCTAPIDFTLSTKMATCDGVEARADAQLLINHTLTNARYDIVEGSSYTGGATYGTAQALPANNILADSLSNPTQARTYTVRVFVDAYCYRDQTVQLISRICNCPQPPQVVPESQTICEGDSLRTIRGYVGPGVTIDWYDAIGNLLKKGSIYFKPTQGGTYFAQARDILSGCKSTIRMPSYAYIDPSPSFQLVLTRGTCNGTAVRADAYVQLLDLKDGSRYGFSKGKTYTGTQTYATATPVPTHGVVLDSLSNPLTTEYYTFRVFGEGDCYTDSTIAFDPRMCECPKPPFVVPESQAVCAGDTLRTIKGFVDLGATVDWYDAPVGGNLLKQGSIYFKPSGPGVYYAEARDTLTNCKGVVRVPSYAFVNELPTYRLEAVAPTCIDGQPQGDGQVRIRTLSHGSRYDLSIGSTYVGGKTYESAAMIPADSILFNQAPNPDSVQAYTIRVFGEPNCFTDQTIWLFRYTCQPDCPNPPLVIPESQSVCEGDTLRTIRGYVIPNATVDWYDAPVGGKLLKQGSIYFKPTGPGVYYAEARDTVSNCKGLVRVPSYAFVNDLPSFTAEAVPPSCLRGVSQNNGMIKLKTWRNGTRYDISTGGSYTGSKMFSTATAIPADSVLSRTILNPSTTQNYTIRIFGEPNCFKDTTLTVTRVECSCTPISISVLPTNFSICEGEPFPVLKGYVDSTATVDWYDKNDNLLLSGSVTFQPTSFGEFYAEGRSLNQAGCVSTTRAKAVGNKILAPAFSLKAYPPNCIGDSPQNNGRITIENLTDGDRFDYSIGQTYTGTATYANAQPIPTSSVLVKDLPNLSQTLTVRIFNQCGLWKDLTIDSLVVSCRCSTDDCFPLKVSRKKK